MTELANTLFCDSSHTEQSLGNSIPLIKISAIVRASFRFDDSMEIDEFGKAVGNTLLVLSPCEVDALNNMSQLIYVDQEGDKRTVLKPL